MRSHPIAALAAATLAFAFSGCTHDALDLGRPQQVDCPAAPGSQAPNLAVGLDGKLYLSWVEPREAGHALRFATWNDGRWSDPKTVAEGDDWFVNRADFPSLAALQDGTLAAHWLVRSGAGTYAYDVNLALSADGGDTWSEPLRPHRDATETEHGFVSLVPSTGGDFGLLWLDGRNTTGTPQGAMALRYATLTPDGELLDEAEVDARVCDCCSTDALRLEDGSILTVYRDRDASEVRDISMARLEGSTWSPPRTVHADTWEIAACPVNGPAVAGRGDSVALAWFTASRNTPRVQLAFSQDAGRTFGLPLRVDSGNPFGRIDVLMLEDGSALVSWLEQAADRAKILFRRVGPAGALGPIVAVATGQSRSSGFPRMVRHQERIFFAWTEDATPSRIATAVLAP